MEKEVYKKMYEREDSFWWHDGMKKIIIMLLDAHFMNFRNNNILDAGCGTGGMLKTLSHYGNVFGVDASDDAVFYSKRRNIGKIIKAEAESLPFDGSFFDLIACFDMLYHNSVKSDIKALEEFKRVLKKGGILLIREPAFDWLRGNIDKIMWTKHRYHKNELVKKLENQGFAVLKISYANFFLFPLVLPFRLLETLFKKTSIENLFASNFLLNSILRQFLYLEARLLKFVNFPFGSSVYCLAKKK